jgi:hypothetical protein
VTTPEEALERARAEAERLRSSGVYAEAQVSPAPRPVTTTANLLEWAVIEPDLDEVRSLRRLGAPVTAFKRGLLRLLAQYTNQQLAQQTRFNLALVARVRELEDRVEQLETSRPPE